MATLTQIRGGDGGVGIPVSAVLREDDAPQDYDRRGSPPTLPPMHTHLRRGDGGVDVAVPAALREDDAPQEAGGHQLVAGGVGQSHPPAHSQERKLDR